MKKYTTLRRLAKIQTAPRDFVIDLLWKIDSKAPKLPFSTYGLRRFILTKYPDPFMRLTHLLERGTNGYTVSDAWDAGSYIEQVVGGLLIQLKEAGNSYPMEYSFEAWQAQLEHHGNVLLRDNDDLPDDFEESVKVEAELKAAKKASMHWVADNLGTLWD